MKHLSEYETALIYRALMLLSFVLSDARSSAKCLELAESFASDYRAGEMLKQSEQK